MYKCIAIYVGIYIYMYLDIDGPSQPPTPDKKSPPLPRSLVMHFLHRFTSSHICNDICTREIRLLKPLNHCPVYAYELVKRKTSTDLWQV